MYLSRHPHKNFYFDVDDTLIMWDIVPRNDLTTVDIKFEDHERTYVVHEEHIEMLKNWSNMGYTIIVWSAAGADWAETVVRALDIKEYVNVCLGKPNVYVDDLNVSGFMPDSNRIYKKLD